MAKKKINTNILNSFIKSTTSKAKKMEETKKKKEEDEKQQKIKEQKELEKKRLKEEHEKLKEKKRREKEINDSINKNRLKTFKIKLTTLSPLHIGDGTELEPISYVVKDNFLYYFDENYVLEKILEENKQVNINKLENIDTLVEFFKSYRDFIINNNLYKTKISVAKDIAKLYDNYYGKSNNDSFNQMLIQKNISTLNPHTFKYEPYIPGSSIKGALQTVLNLSVDEGRLLKISDTTGVNVKNQIAWSLRKTKNKDIPQKLEIISKSSIYAFELSKSNIFSLEELKEKLNNFYQQNDKEAYLNFSREIRNENQFLLRLGRYVGQKFMSNYPDIPNPKTKAMFSASEKNSKSQLPFGWVMCEILE